MKRLALNRDPKKLRLLLTSLIVFTLMTPRGNSVSARTPGTTSPPDEGNGIVVGQPKLYNPDTLQKMLEEVEEQLRTLKFLNADQVGEAVGGVQGGRSTSSRLSLNVTGGGTPSLKTTSSDTDGDGATDSRETTESRDARSPEAPTPASPAPVFSGIQPSGVAAQDILNEQTALTYQAINLRLLLDRAISDRVNGSGKVRQQAVVGFQVSLAPQPEFKDAVAVVEMSLKHNYKESKVALADFRKNHRPGDNPQLYEAVEKAMEEDEDKRKEDEGTGTLSAKDTENAYARDRQANEEKVRQTFKKAQSQSAQQRTAVSDEASRTRQPGVGHAVLVADERRLIAENSPSLVALLPQEKTYNVVSITKDSKSIGLGAVAGLLSVGFGASRDKETFYIVKDTDTVALQKPSLTDGTLRFGWQFQPVLGRRIITPGIRQVYAAIALPGSIDEDFVGHISVKTYWRKWDRKTNTPGADVKPTEKIAGCAEAGCAQDFTYPLRVYRGTIMEEMLVPQVADVDWEEAGPNMLRVKIEGTNFTPETAIRIGSKLYDRENGSLGGTAESKLLVLPAVDLVTVGKDPLLVTRFGTRELRARKADRRRREAREKGAWGLKIEGAIYQPLDAEIARVALKLKTRDNQKDLKQDRLLVLIGDQVFGLRGKPFLPPKDRGTLENEGEDLDLIFDAPLKLIEQHRQLTVRRPFWGSGFADTAEIEPCSGKTNEIKRCSGKLVITHVTRLAQGAGDKIHLAIHGYGLAQDVKVILGDHEFSSGGANPLVLRNERLLTITPTKEQLAAAKQLVATQGDEIKMLKLADPPRSPAFNPKVISVRLGDTSLRVKGDNLDTISDIRHLGVTLTVIPESDGSLTVHFPADVTKYKGEKGFEVILKDTSKLNLPVIVGR